MRLSHYDADAIAALHRIEPDSPVASQLSASTIQNFADTQRPQTLHRINIVKSWDVDLAGRHVLEIGCGQGDASVVLARAVEDGLVTAWDPASPDYGSPLTVAQAQANLSSKPQLSRLTFRLGCPLVDLLHDKYDVAVLLHCIYYFPSIGDLFSTLTDLHSRVDTLCVAEYSLQTSTSSQLPHVLAVLAQQALETIRPLGESQSNVQTVISPAAIVDLAKSAGWSLVREQIITPDEELQDGRWEVGTVCNPSWMTDIDRVLEHASGDGSNRHRAWLSATRDATLAAVRTLADPGGGEGQIMRRVRTMDVWCAVFKRVSPSA